MLLVFSLLREYQLLLRYKYIDCQPWTQWPGPVRQALHTRSSPQILLHCNSFIIYLSRDTMYRITPLYITKWISTQYFIPTDDARRECRPESYVISSRLQNNELSFSNVSYIHGIHIYLHVWITKFLYIMLKI